MSPLDALGRFALELIAIQAFLWYGIKAYWAAAQAKLRWNLRRKK